MNKKAIIYDLDNTIYSVLSIGEELFASLFKLIEESGNHQENINMIKDAIMHKPFQVVARTYNFSEELTQQSITILKDLTYKGDIQPFEDYTAIREIPGERFLVTTGFKKLQYSKIVGMGIEQDFKEIHIVDPSTSARTKKDVFAEIMKRYHYQPTEVLVVGDDPESEIKAAQDLGIDTVLYDKHTNHLDTTATYRITNFRELKALID